MGPFRNGGLSGVNEKYGELTRVQDSREECALPGDGAWDGPIIKTRLYISFFLINERTCQLIGPLHGQHPARLESRARCEKVAMIRMLGVEGVHFRSQSLEFGSTSGLEDVDVERGRRWMDRVGHDNVDDATDAESAGRLNGKKKKKVVSWRGCKYVYNYTIPATLASE